MAIFNLIGWILDFIDWVLITALKIDTCQSRVISTIHLNIQIKGKILTGKFSENKIKYINLLGNATLKYFNEKNKKIDGVNDIISDKMKIYFNESDIDKIYFNGSPDAHYTPIQLIEKSKIYLDGFLIRE